jgi:predicted DNA-binding transcriptional regulator AlpA
MVIESDFLACQSAKRSYRATISYMKGNKMERLMSRKEVADFLGLSSQTLARWAWAKTGPKFSKLGKYARYRQQDVKDWIDSSTVPSEACLPKKPTSEFTKDLLMSAGYFQQPDGSWARKANS